MQDAPQVAGDHHATPHAKKSGEATGDKTNTQPLTGYLYPVGVTRDVRIANSEFGISINQFDEHRNRFVEVIERVRFLDADGVMTDRLIVIVCGVIVQIVAHDDSPRTVIVKIGEDVRMIPRAALIFIFLHLAKRFSTCL
jgi:hypothetical protein